MDEVHDAGEVCGTPNAQEERPMVGEISITINGECVPLLSFCDDTEDKAGTARGRAHEIAALNGTNGHFRHGDRVTTGVFPKFSCIGDETKRTRHRWFLRCKVPER